MISYTVGRVLMIFVSIIWKSLIWILYQIQHKKSYTWIVKFKRKQDLQSGTAFSNKVAK